jgi:LmbE family N-acetylglucosaminyl deacetylase
MRAGDLHLAWTQFPMASAEAIVGRGRTLILAPHPDDESLGCGGLIAACCAVGRPPLVAILTDGTGSHPNSRAYPPERLRAVRMQEARDAVAHLGLSEERLVFLDQPDTAAAHEGPAFDALVDTLTARLRRDPACTTLLAPWRFDPHCDHEAAAKLGAQVADRCGVRSVAYPVWGWTLPRDQSIPAPVTPGWRLDIADDLPAKRHAIQAHRSQYGGLIADDPTGFQLPPGLLAVFDTQFETFIQP